MTLHEILYVLLQQALLCDMRYENKEAIRLCLRIEAQLYKLNDITFSAQFYLNFCKIYLNGGNINEAINYINKFDFFCNGKNLDIPIIDFRYYLMGRILFLKGNYTDCVNYIDQNINKIRTSVFRSRLYEMKSYIETENNQGFSTYNNMSLALGEAENSQDKERIAQCYLELGRALNQTYNALGISLLRQAERIAKEIKNNELYYSSIIQRASAYIFLGIKYNNEDFRIEAEKIINSIEENDLKFIGLKELYWSTKGWMLGNTNLLIKSLDYNEKVGAWERVSKILIPLYHIYMEQNNKKEALSVAQKGANVSVKCGNQKLQAFFMEKINLLK